MAAESPGRKTLLFILIFSLISQVLTEDDTHCNAKNCSASTHPPITRLSCTSETLSECNTTSRPSADVDNSINVNITLKNITQNEQLIAITWTDTVSSPSQYRFHFSTAFGGPGPESCRVYNITNNGTGLDSLQNRTVEVSTCIEQLSIGRTYNLQIARRPFSSWRSVQFQIINSSGIAAIQYTSATPASRISSTSLPLFERTNNAATVDPGMPTWSISVVNYTAEPGLLTSTRKRTTVKITSTSTSSPRTTPSSTTPALVTNATGGGVKISPIPKPEESNLSIILGSVLGVVGALVLIGVLVFVCRRNIRNGRHFQMQRFGPNRNSDASIDTDLAFKNNPNVLLLYSYDCPAHEKVVSSFALYLKEVCGCDVWFDLWQQNEIQECGFMEWFRQCLEKADCVLIIVSTGVRFKCSQKNKFQVKSDHPIADMIVPCSDMVVEKVRSDKNEDKPLTKYMVAYFDYTTESDIPPKLDLVQRYCLMVDIYLLYCQLHGVNPELWNNYLYGARHTGVKVENYAKTIQGKELENAIKSARVYFKNNPNWLQEKLEPLFSKDAPDDPVEQKKDSGDKQEGSKNEGEDADDEGMRRRKRRKDGLPEEIALQDMPKDKKGKSPVISDKTNRAIISNGPNKDLKTSPNTSNGGLTENGPPLLTNQLQNGNSKTNETVEGDEDLDTEDQLIKDISFIMNNPSPRTDYADSGESILNIPISKKSSSGSKSPSSILNNFPPLTSLGSRTRPLIKSSLSPRKDDCDTNKLLENGEAVAIDMNAFQVNGGFEDHSPSVKEELTFHL